MANATAKPYTPAGPFRFGEEEAPTLDGACTLVKNYCDEEIGNRRFGFIEGGDGRFYNYEILVVIDGPAMVVCPVCNGNGSYKCPSCKGIGYVTAEDAV